MIRAQFMDGHTEPFDADQINTENNVSALFKEGLPVAVVPLQHVRFIEFVRDEEPVQ